MARVLRVVLALVLACALIIGALMLREPAFVYTPADRVVSPPATGLALKQRPVTYNASDGTKLTAWIIPAKAQDSAAPWLLICHGNYGNIGYAERPEFYAFMRDIGVNLLAFDYRGFGASAGTPTESGLNDDGMASYRFLRDSLHVPAERIVLFGHSLGSAVAIDLATRVTAAALIVEGAMTSVWELGHERYPYLPVETLMKARYASIDKIGKVAIPKLFLHSPEDEAIPFADGQRLFAAAAEPKYFQSVKGGHSDAYRIDKAVYFDAIRNLLAPLYPSISTAHASVIPSLK